MKITETGSLERAFKETEQRLKEFTRSSAQAGIFPEAAYPDGTPVAYVAAIQEYGAPTVNIPARHPFRSAVKDNEARWAASMRQGVQAVVRGNIDVEDVLEQVGGVMAADIQSAIADTSSPPLSPITVMLRGMRRNDPSLVVTGKTVGEAAQRVAEGKTNYGASEKPLVDTGLLLASITHKTGPQS